jgi:two-component system, chemotaxis family, sensor kinase CheA
MSFSQEEQLKYKALYLQTAREYTKDLLDNLTQLHTDKETKESIDILHRDAHSLKGQSEMMGYHSISALSRLMENIFFAKKENNLELTNEIIMELTNAVKQIDVSLNEIDKVNKELDMYTAIQKLKSLVPTVEE